MACRLLVNRSFFYNMNKVVASVPHNLTTHMRLLMLKFPEDLLSLGSVSSYSIPILFRAVIFELFMFRNVPVGVLVPWKLHVSRPLYGLVCRGCACYGVAKPTSPTAEAAAAPCSQVPLVVLGGAGLGAPFSHSSWGGSLPVHFPLCSFLWAFYHISEYCLCRYAELARVKGNQSLCYCLQYWDVRGPTDDTKWLWVENPGLNCIARKSY